MEKRDLKLLMEFIAKGYPKIELNYACVGRGGIFATDTRRAIMFHNSELRFGDMLVHKKLLKGFEGLMKKDDRASFIVNGSKTCLEFDGTALVLDTATFEHKFPDDSNILDQKLDHHFVLSDLSDINFELSQKYCFIESAFLYPLMEHSGCDKYDVFYSAQNEENFGMVKIVGTKADEEEGDVVFYTAVIMGREFKSQAKE